MLAAFHMCKLRVLFDSVIILIAVAIIRILKWKFVRLVFYVCWEKLHVLGKSTRVSV